MNKILNEMPQLIAGSIDWGLQDKKSNIRRRDTILGKPNQILYKNMYGCLHHRESSEEGGEFAMIFNQTNLITYYMKYKIKNIPIFGRCATQVKLWNSMSLSTIGLPQKVFFEIMLKNFDAMISDRQHTEDGRRFWIRRLTESVDRGLGVGIIENGKNIEYDPSTSFDTWLTEEADGWGKSVLYQEKLFYILA